MKAAIKLIIATVCIFAAAAHSVLISIVASEAPAVTAVRESARQIPVIDTVDVIVVGGSSAGVAAAVSAADAGAKVFLASERTYVGEDLCGTYRLWLKTNEVPATTLETAVFGGSAAPAIPPGFSFSYQADQPSQPKHVDTEPGTLLNDGKLPGAATESVQFNTNVNITVDLGAVRDFARVGLYSYQASSYAVKEVSFYSRSATSEEWTLLGTDTAGSVSTNTELFELKLNGRGRFIKLSVKKDPALTRCILGEIFVTDIESTGPAPVRPMQVKMALSKALMGAGVNFLFGSMITDVLVDNEGNPSGVVIANRSGRQAVLGKVVVDATPRSLAARLAGARFSPPVPGARTFQYITVGNYVKTGNGITDVEALTPLSEDGSGHPAHLYTLSVDMPDDTLYSYSRAEQKIRDLTWDKLLVDAANRPFEIPSDWIISRSGAAGAWPGYSLIPPSVFCPTNVSRLFVLNGCAEINRDAASAMLRPLEYFRTGGRIGLLAAQQAETVALPQTVQRKTGAQGFAVPMDIRERLTGLRELPATNAVYVQIAEGVLPVFGKTDVAVVGGGVGGASAGIGAVSNGASTVVVEYLYGLGGTGTDGLVSKYFGGNQGGFTAKLDALTEALTGLEPSSSAAWNIEAKKEAYRQMIRTGGGEIIFGAVGCGVVMSGSRVCGVVVTTPLHGRGVILANAVVDGTGNAEMAIAAGAAYEFIDAKSPAMQGTGLPPPRNLPGRDGYWLQNGDVTFTDNADALDAKRSYILGAEFASAQYDMSQMIQTRERRRITGEKTLTPVDVAMQRTFADTIGYANSSFDSHGFVVHPLFALKAPAHAKYPTYIPYGALIPKEVDGLLVAGIGLSVHRDAVASVRMQPDVQNLGYAAGRAAAMAARNGGHTREIDLAALQQHLVTLGMFPGSVEFSNSQPFTEARLQTAVNDLCTAATVSFTNVAWMMTQTNATLPLLRDAYGRGSIAETNRLWIARILGMCGDNTGVQALITALNRYSVWDAGWNFKAFGQYSDCYSELDSLVMSAGCTRDPSALPQLLRLAGLLNETSELSHIIAISGALESIGDPQAAPVLAALLNKPGMTGYAVSDFAQAVGAKDQMNDEKNMFREHPLRELFLARALYRLGDQNGLARGILENYSRDLHSLYATHAALVLRSGMTE